MFVVPLYAFLTTTVNKSETARTVAANNVVNSGAMTIGAVAILGATGAGLSIAGALLLVAVMCLMSAWLGWKLHRACRSEEHTSELQSLMRTSYAVFCLK